MPREWPRGRRRRTRSATRDDLDIPYDRHGLSSIAFLPAPDTSVRKRALRHLVSRWMSWIERTSAERATHTMKAADWHRQLGRAWRADSGGVGNRNELASHQVTLCRLPFPAGGDQPPVWLYFRFRSACAWSRKCWPRAASSSAMRRCGNGPRSARHSLTNLNYG